MVFKKGHPNYNKNCKFTEEQRRKGIEIRKKLFAVPKINFHRLGRLVILNNELFLLSEKRYNQIMNLNKPFPTILHLIDEKKRRIKHQKLCDKVRKYGNLIGQADIMLRDD